MVCRLFGLTAAPRRVHATFWLLEAPDSLAEQSRREPDGTGLGIFTESNQPWLTKRPLAAYQDTEFAQEAKQVESTTFLAHVRYASTGGLRSENTHPFLQHDRFFAHNGVIDDLPRLEAELGSYLELVQGDTDSERFFALITKHIDASHGNVTAGISAAVQWIAENLPLFAVNFILTTAQELWALRYPDTHDLFILERAVGGQHGGRHLEHASRAGRVRVRSGELADAPAVVVASERMDEDNGWRPLTSGELVHIDGQLNVQCQQILTGPPAHLLSLADLGHTAAASQAGK